MYEKYFGFQRPPFELVPDPDFLFLGQSHDAALANLVMGIDSGKGFVAISGPVGAGKTTVLRALLRRLARGERVCYLAQPELNTADMLRAILDGFGIQPIGGEVPELRRALREFMRAAEAPGILIVDEAHLLSVDALEQIRLLSNLEEEDRKLLQIILAGQPELKQVLSSERLRPLAQRIEMFYEIEALDLADTQAYLERRMRIAGNPETVKFEPAAVALIHECSGGIPRLINILADRTLVTAYVEETGQITDGLVTDAYHDLGEVTQSVMPGSPRTRRGFQRTSRFTPDKTPRPRVEPVREEPPVAAAPVPAPEPVVPVTPEPPRPSSAELTVVRDPEPMSVEPARPVAQTSAEPPPAPANPVENAPAPTPAPIDFDHIAGEAVWSMNGEGENVRAGLVVNGERVAKPLSRHENGRRAAPLQQRIGGDGGAHLHRLNALARRRCARPQVQGAPDALNRRIGVQLGVFGQHFERAEPAVGRARDHVGEGAAAINPKLPARFGRLGHGGPILEWERQRARVERRRDWPAQRRPTSRSRRGIPAVGRD